MKAYVVIAVALLVFIVAALILKGVSGMQDDNQDHP